METRRQRVPALPSPGLRTRLRLITFPGPPSIPGTSSPSYSNRPTTAHPHTRSARAPRADTQHRPNLIWYNRIILDALSYVWPSGMIKSTDLADACLRLAGGKGWDLRSEEHAIENADLKRLAEAYRESLAMA